MFDQFCQIMISACHTLTVLHMIAHQFYILTVRSITHTHTHEQTQTRTHAHTHKHTLKH